MTLNSYELAAESRDAAVHNQTAGNTELAKTHALIAIMHLLSAQNEPSRITVNVVPGDGVPDFDAISGRLWHLPEVSQGTSAPLPTEQGVYRSADGIPWFRSAVEMTTPWLDITRAHCEDRWFTEAEAAKHAPFTRMEAAA